MSPEKLVVRGLAQGSSKSLICGRAARNGCQSHPQMYPFMYPAVTSVHRTSADQPRSVAASDQWQSFASIGSRISLGRRLRACR
jgi:hypothetical protein